jgi:hypothetical protein
MEIEKEKKEKDEEKEEEEPKNLMMNNPCRVLPK